MNHALGKLYASEKAAYKWMLKMVMISAISNGEKRFINFIYEISSVIFPKFSPRHNLSCAAAASLSGNVLLSTGLSLPALTRSIFNHFFF
jgi:hypothetical protein